MPAIQRLVGVALITISLYGCGLPTVTVLFPPSTDIATTIIGDRLAFQHDPENDRLEFTGYEIYYKIYLPANAAAEERAASDRIQILQPPVPPGINRLRGAGFARLALATVRDGGVVTPPNASQLAAAVVPVPDAIRASSFTVTLDFTGPAQPEGLDLLVRWPASPTFERGFRRRNDEIVAAQNPTNLDSFWKRADYALNDTDLQSMVTQEQFDEFSGDRSAVLLSLFAIATGLDPATFQVLYSEPAFVGEITIPLEN